MKVIEYEIVRSLSVNELQEVVNKKLRDGYSPLGGVVTNSKDTYFQTLVKEEDEDE